jgi:hypothetical protein
MGLVDVASGESGTISYLCPLDGIAMAVRRRVDARCLVCNTRREGGVRVKVGLSACISVLTIVLLGVVVSALFKLVGDTSVGAPARGAATHSIVEQSSRAGTQCATVRVADPVPSSAGAKSEPGAHQEAKGWMFVEHNGVGGFVPVSQGLPPTPPCAYAREVPCRCDIAGLG